MDHAINNALMKASLFAYMLSRYDPRGPREDPDLPAPVPQPLADAALTAFTIQLASVFDEGLTAVWQASRPDKRPPAFGVIVNEMADAGQLVGPGDVKKVVAIRNRLAHEMDSRATWGEYAFVEEVARRDRSDPSAGSGRAGL